MAIVASSFWGGETPPTKSAVREKCGHGWPLVDSQARATMKSDSDSQIAAILDGSQEQMPWMAAGGRYEVIDRELDAKTAD